MALLQSDIGQAVLATGAETIATSALAISPVISDGSLLYPKVVRQLLDQLDELRKADTDAA